MSRISRMVVVGLDGATFGLIKPWVDAGLLPTFARLLGEGAHAELRSTLPALTPPAWTSAATGKNPGKHNIFNFYKVSDGGTGKLPLTPADLRSRRVWDIANAYGKRAGVVHLPLTYPPEHLDGFVVSGHHDAQGRRRLHVPCRAPRRARREHRRLPLRRRRRRPQGRRSARVPRRRLRPPAHPDRRDALPPREQGMGPAVGDVPHPRQGPALLLALHGPRRIPRTPVRASSRTPSSSSIRRSTPPSPRSSIGSTTRPGCSSCRTTAPARSSPTS